MPNPTFKKSDAGDRPSVEVVKSAQGLFGPGAEVSLGTTAEGAIPLALSSRAGGKMPVSNERAVFVGCGPLSKGLCAVLFHQQESLNKFVAANPITRRTLATRALSQELIFWFYCEDWTPQNTATTDLKWCSAGKIPLCWIDEKLELRIMQNLPVIKIKFADFRWDSESDREFWLARQEFLFGPVFRQVGPRKRVINENILCRVFAKDAGIVFDSVGQRFYHHGECGVLEYLSAETLLEQLAAWLEHWAKRCGTCFPANELRLPRIRSIVQHLKLIAAAYEPDAREVLYQYAKDRLRAKDGTDLAVREIYADYLGYAEKSPIGRYPLCRFHRQLPKALEELFGAVRSHNLRRLNGDKVGWRRGFHGLTFADAEDGKDGAVGKEP